ncbi:copper resistance protein NlpE N-terminal domain-containing protein [Fulvivirga sedimenti]|uniref:Copper resistance protein NlpE N-terminal domain-containing protein n=1 Tax=Fulvivirga sedimenti TaxID=2879465 RepID=A0A9X1HKX9_9BACT|nr:copper resistance protein NlpE N-terminal domain-containing protein [Fulvivirga sedimenti]MCA6073791.1 copper resistance protein NlpE N-terminal domain-containing protein [Fulvivirga sedimenti]
MRIFTFALFIWLAGCSTTPEYSENPMLAQRVAGVYSGNLPCDDCDGIRYRLVLKSDHTYDAQRIYQGSTDEPVLTSGSYVFADSTLRLDGMTDMNLFAVGNASLYMLSETGEFSEDERYTLMKLSRDAGTPEPSAEQAEGNDPWIRQYREGIDFYATGNEPFWNVQMDFDKFIKFTRMGGPEITLPPVEGIRAQDANVILYRGETETGSLDVTILQQSCTDNMSGAQRPFKVRVRYKTGDDEDFTELEGCGNYVANPRLHNIWAVVSVNDVALDPEQYTGGIPRLELFTAEGRVLGFDGCNTFNGSFYEKDQQLYFSALMSTLMACMDIPDSQVPALLSSKRFDYAFEDGMLVLTRGNERVVLRNID